MITKGMLGTGICTLFAGLLGLASQGHTAALDAAQAWTQYAIQPMAFEARPDDGGCPAYAARGAGYRVGIQADGSASLTLIRPGRQDANAITARDFQGETLRLALLGAQEGACPQPGTPAAGVRHHYQGRDPAGWRTRVPLYKEVRQPGVYPGIDLVWYGRQRDLEFDFVVRPGADPAQIRFTVEGARDITLAADGSLDVATSHGQLRQHAPVAYQEVDGQHTPVAAGYVLAKGSEGMAVALRLGAYDTARPLVIDPVLSYSTYFGGNGDEGFEAVAADAAGNVYLAGWTGSQDFPTAAPVQSDFAGWIDAVVVKLAAGGGSLVYSTYLGGPLVVTNNGPFTYNVGGYDYAYGIAVDADGNAYITGKTSSPDFPVTAGAYDTTCGLDGACDVPPTATTSVFDAFVTKLAADGTLVYSTFLGGSNQDIPDAIAVDAAGGAYVTGWTASADYPVLRAVQPNRGGYTDAFVTKLGADGAALAYSTYLGGAISGTSPSSYLYNRGTGIAVDAAGSAYVTGETSTADFPVTPGALRTTYAGGFYDGYVAKLAPGGATLVYSTYLGGGGSDSPKAIAVDGGGNAYVAGTTQSADYPVVAAYQAALSGSSDAFLSKLNVAGNALAYSGYLGGSADETATGVAVNALGQAHVAGYTTSADFPTANAIQAGNAGGMDVFLSKFTGNGGSLVYSTYLGGGVGFFGTANDLAYGVALDDSGAAYLAGSTQALDFPVVNAYQSTMDAAYGISDGFVARIADATPISCNAGGGLGFQASVRDASRRGVAGVNLTLVGPNDCNDTLVTNRRGTATFPGLAAGRYTLTPAKAGCGFQPATVTRNLSNTDGRARFVATCL